MWQVWLRFVEPLERRLRRPGAQTAVATSAIVVLLAGALPFALFSVFGPETFEEPLTLGAIPTLDNAPLPQQTDAEGNPLGPPPSVDLPPDGVDRLAPDILLNLGPNVRVTLLFSVGSRAVSDKDAERLRINDIGRRGDDGLTDVIMLVIADPDSGRVGLLSIPRDYYLRSRAERINATWFYRGTQGLVDDVGLITGLPIHHVALMNFTAFGELVDRLGGVAMRTDKPLADLASNLYVPDAGCWQFSGADALAYVRSRNTLTQNQSDRWVRDVTASDFGRIARQQQLIGAAFDQLRGPQALARIPDLVSVARDGLVVDRGLDLQASRQLVNAFLDVRAGSFEGYTIPSNNTRIDEKAVLVADKEAVVPIMERLRSWPPTDALVLPDDQPSTDADLGEIGEIAVDENCNAGDATQLPDPFGPLAAVAATQPRQAPSRSATPSPRPSSSQSGSSSPSPSTTSSPDEPSESEPDVAPQPTASTSETDEPTASPKPSDSASPSSSPSPTAEPSPSAEPSETETSILPRP